MSKEENSNPTEINTNAVSTSEPKANVQSSVEPSHNSTTSSTTVSSRPEPNTATTKPTPTAAPKTPKAAKSKHPDTAFRATIVALLLLSLLTAGASLTMSIINLTREDQPITWNFTNDGNSANFVEGSVADIASKVAPGVVSIVTESRTTGWFGQSSTQTSAGTGMIVTKDGHVLTNKHVVDGANSIKVVLDSGETYDKVTLVGTDPLNDVAFLKINDVDNLPIVKLGDSKTIIAGQQVIAIGNALGQYQNTITQGIISGTGRSLTAYSSDYSDAENLTDMIQTDAAINAGNSGGPLVNAAGEVIGINTATSTDADGIGFAIPISSVKGMLKNIIENNSATRAYMGIYYINITPDVAVTYDLPVTFGAYLTASTSGSAIISDGPGEQAGLKDGDIITKINGIDVGKAGTVSSLIGEYAPGDTIQITVLRDKEEKNIKLTLGAYGSKSQKS